MPERLGPYRLLDTLGQGSFGVVYLAVRDGTEDQVALKVLPNMAELDREDLQRFWLEGQVARRLDHPGVVPGIELGEAHNHCFLAMEYVPGETLKQRIARGRLPLEEAVRVVSSLAETLAAVHAAGVVHRDLKPANVILDARTDEPRITDFGLARDRSLLRSVTKTGDVIGTPVYMAPEQIQGKKLVDHQVDVYALGAIFYECLTGQRPHQASTIYELGQKIVSDDPTPPTRLRPELPPLVDEVCAQAMAKQRGDRYRDCRVFADALRELLHAPAAAPAPSRAPKALAFGAVALLAGGLGVAIGLRSGPAEPEPAVSDAALEAPPSEPAPPRDLLEAARRVQALLRDGARRAEASELAGIWAAAARARPLKGLSADDLERVATLLETAASGQDRSRVLEARVRAYLLRAEEASPTELPRLIHAARALADRHASAAWTERIDLAHARLLIARGAYDRAGDVLRERVPRIRDKDLLLRARLLRVDIEGSKRSGWSARPQLLDELCKRAGRETVVGCVARGWLATYVARWGSRGRRRGRDRDRAKEERYLREAERLARRAIELEPDFVPARILLARALSSLRSPEAEAAWEAAWKAGPRDARVALAQAYAYRRGDEKREAQARDRFLELTRGTRSYVRSRQLRSRGWERVVAGEEGARADLAEVLETRTFDMRPWLGLGILSLRAGDLDAARERIRIAAALSPEPGRHNRDVAHYLGELSPDERNAALDLTPPPAIKALTRELPGPHREPLTEALHRATSSMASHDAVADALRLAAKVTPDAPAAALLRARIAVGRHLFALADAALTQAEALRADPATVALLRADLALRRGQRAKAKAGYAKLAQGQGRLATIARAELHLLDHQPGPARRLAAALLAKNSQDTRARLLKSSATFGDDPTTGLVDAARARAHQGDLDVRALLLQHRAHINCLALNLRAWLPESHYTTIPKLAPSAAVRLSLARTMLALLHDQPLPGLFDRTRQLLRAAAKRDPDHPKLPLYSGWERLLAKDTAAAVLADWKRYRERDPTGKIPKLARATFLKRFPNAAAQLEALAPK